MFVGGTQGIKWLECGFLKKIVLVEQRIYTCRYSSKFLLRTDDLLMCHLPPLNIVSCTCHFNLWLWNCARAKSRLSIFFTRMTHKKIDQISTFSTECVNVSSAVCSFVTLSPVKVPISKLKKIIIILKNKQTKKQEPPCGEERQMDEICYYFW